VSRRLRVRVERWPLARPFVIARGTKTTAEVVVAEIADCGTVGRGEGVPYARFGETVDGVVEMVRSSGAAVAGGLDRAGLLTQLPAGAARNAIDCALWDLEAKLSGRCAWHLAGVPPPRRTMTAETVSLGTAAAMADQASRLADRPLLKIKLDREAIVPRVTAVRRAAPAARLIVDANEGWTVAELVEVAPDLARLGVELIEQPVAATADAGLAGLALPIRLCADESSHTAADLERMIGRYQAINIKLDKAGGLTAALDLAATARAAGLGVMLGCMVATSLSIAPALLLAGDADPVDLDGPLWLARDREPSLCFTRGWIEPASPDLWG
jgi:L-alanine-DL-glutamate epimerase-like enolase superfamily enzyme